MTFVISQEFIKKAVLNAAQNQKCIDMHSGSCTIKAFQQLKMGTKSIAPLYFIVHIVPLLLKYKKLKQNPLIELKKFVISFSKSIMFVASTLFIIRRGICLSTEIYRYTNTSAVLAGLVCGFPLLLESPGRQIQMSLYALNKSLEQLYYILSRRYPKLYIEHGQIWLFAVSASILTYFYTQDRNYFRETYKKTLDLLFLDI